MRLIRCRQAVRAVCARCAYYVEGDRKTSPFIGLNEEPGHRGNATRFAFWADPPCSMRVILTLLDELSHLQNRPGH